MAEPEPSVDVVEIRGEKRVAFEGLEYLEFSTDAEDDLLDRYEELLIQLDDLADQYEGATLGWHIGRTLDEYNVGQNTEITLADVAKYNSIDVDERRMTYCRNIYEFWPDQGFDPDHSITSLGELASRANGQGRSDEARKGYRRLRQANENLTRNDIFAWYDLADVERDWSLDCVTAAVVDHYDDPQSMVNSIKRVFLLAGLDLSQYPRDEIIAAIKRNASDRSD